MDIPVNAAINYYRRVFHDLPAPEMSTLHGQYRAQFVGPAWLRAVAGPAVALGGMPGWWGKDFGTQGGAQNILSRGGRLRRILPMTVRSLPSLSDGRLGISLLYGPGAPLPWRWVVDELRQVDTATLLCMTIVNLPLLRRLPLPFLLQRREAANGV